MAKKKETKKKSPRQKRIITKDTPLTIKEQKFVDEYIQTGNGKQSILKAGYNVSERSAPEYANRLLKKVNVVAELEERRNIMKKNSIMSAEEVMEYFTAVARGEIKDQFGLDAPLSERTRAAQEIAKRTIDLDNRLQGKADANVVIKLDWGRGGNEQ